MHNATAPYEPSIGLWYALGGVTVFVIGGMLLANTNEDPTFFGTSGIACFAVGLYLLVVGGVARGNQLARRFTPAPAAPAPVPGTPTP